MFSHFIFWRIKLMNENWKTFMTLPFFLIKYYAIVFGKCTYVEIFIWIACESDQTFWVNWLYASSSKSAFLMFWVMHVESLRAPLNLGGLTRTELRMEERYLFLFFPLNLNFAPFLIFHWSNRIKWVLAKNYACLKKNRLCFFCFFSFTRSLEFVFFLLMVNLFFKD